LAGAVACKAAHRVASLQDLSRGPSSSTSTLLVLLVARKRPQAVATLVVPG
jgi:hypothetical protein